MTLQQGKKLRNTLLKTSRRQQKKSLTIKGDDYDYTSLRSLVGSL